VADNITVYNGPLGTYTARTTDTGAGVHTQHLNIDAVSSGFTTITDGRKTVTTAGTRVQLSSSSVSAKRVTISALSTNTGVVCVGGSTVVASAGTRTGVGLQAGDYYELDITNLNLVYLDSTVNGEGVSFTYFT
jgi:hypothetical protein